jgi:oxygen-independent coproporphyrinogen-3 oxidase
MSVSPSHLYIHVPFCIRKCRYCDFYSQKGSEAMLGRYIHCLALEHEQARDHDNLSAAPLETIFYGGGTPSLLTAAQWGVLHTATSCGIQRINDYECTIECNPDSFTPAKAAAWLETGVNRLTLGVQSLDDRELATLGRPHSAGQALAVLGAPILERFASVGVDVMYGLPGQTPASQRRTLRQLLSIPTVKHLSAYELTIAAGTPFGRHGRLLPLPGEEAGEEIYAALQEEAAEHGFEQYEISNYSRTGFRCRHNLAYWHHRPYRGLGPAAHSYVHPRRFANVSDIEGYCALLEENRSPVDFSETLDSAALGREMIFLGLRTVDGIDERMYATHVCAEFQTPARRQILEQLQAAGTIVHTPPFWRLTPAGMRLADGVARVLID